MSAPNLLESIRDYVEAVYTRIYGKTKINELQDVPDFLGLLYQLRTYHFPGSNQRYGLMFAKFFSELDASGKDLVAERYSLIAKEVKSLEAQRVLDWPEPIRQQQTVEQIRQMAKLRIQQRIERRLAELMNSNDQYMFAMKVNEAAAFLADPGPKKGLYPLLQDSIGDFNKADRKKALEEEARKVIRASNRYRENYVRLQNFLLTSISSITNSSDPEEIMAIANADVSEEEKENPNV